MKATSNAPRILRAAVGWWCLLALGVGVVQAADLEITRGPTNFCHSVSIGATVTDRVWFSGGTSPYTYQWRLSGAPIPWATSYTITLTNVQVADAGPYDIVVTDAVGASVTSEIDELEVNPTFAMITAPNFVTDGIPTPAAVWFDYDNDGFEDLYNGVMEVPTTRCTTTMGTAAFR